MKVVESIILVDLMVASATEKRLKLKECGMEVEYTERTEIRGRELKKFSFTVTREKKKKKCRCNVSSMKKCRRCGRKCCHILGNGTEDCQEKRKRSSARSIFKQIAYCGSLYNIWVTFPKKKISYLQQDELILRTNNYLE